MKYKDFINNVTRPNNARTADHKINNKKVKNTNKNKKISLTLEFERKVLRCKPKGWSELNE